MVTQNELNSILKLLKCFTKNCLRLILDRFFLVIQDNDDQSLNTIYTFTFSFKCKIQRM